MFAGPARPTSPPLAGLALLVPALLALLVSLVWPTLWTLWTSLQRSSPLSSSRFVGGDNYGRMLSDPVLGHALGQALLLAIVLGIAVTAVTAPLALLIRAGGRSPRLVARLALSVPLAFFAPAAGAGAWLAWLSAPGSGHPLADPVTAAVTVIEVAAASSFGVACGAGLLVLMAALRGRPATAIVGVASLAGWAILLAALLAAALQAFASSFLLTRGGPQSATMTVSLLQYQLAFERLDFGDGAVVASLLLIVLALLGAGAVALAAATRLRIELGDAESPKPPKAGTPPGLVVIAGLAALAVAVAIVLWGGWPRLAAAGAGLGAAALGVPLGTAAANTVAPALLSAFVQVLVAFVGAIAIGGLRPLGQHSGWLLLPFAPWLLVGPAPLSLAGFEWERTANLNGTAAALVPPVLVSVPALFVLTLCCRGRSRAAERLVAAGVAAPEALLRAVVLPVLPMAGLLLGAVALVDMQELLWPLLVAQSPRQFSLPLLMAEQAGEFAASRSSLAFLVTLQAVPGLVALAVLAVAQVVYLDRLQLRAGPPEP